MRASPWRPGLALAFLLALPVEARPADETVRLDLVSESVGQRLPFDVPFLLEGEAPPGTSRVEMRLRLKTPARTLEAEGEAPHAVSGTDSAGRFRLQGSALPADRDVRFELVLERSLTENGRRMFRQDVEALLRREMAPGWSATAAGDERLRDGIQVAFTRALAEGRAAGAPRGELTLASPGGLFDPRATPEQVAPEMTRLSREVRAARSGLEAAVQRQEDAVPSLTAALAEIDGTDALAALVAGLEARPELDPRNPRSPLALSEEARALALGEAPAVPRILGGGPAEIAAARWASVLEDYAADAERALVAEDRALVAMLGNLEAAAIGVVVRERATVTGSTAAGLYVSLDLGLLYGFEVDRGALYAGVNLYLAPVNKDARCGARSSGSGSRSRWV